MSKRSDLIMISLSEAEQLVSSSKYAHSMLVASLMRSVAEQLGADVDTWMLVGLLHDIDYDETINEPSMHGVAAAKRLSGLLPDHALDAIRRHDHRTGLVPETDLGFSLVLCDAVSIVLEETGLKRSVCLNEFQASLGALSEKKPWLVELVMDNSILDRVELGLILESQ
jgi:putative nucleotidyltransferase with HDIG domain